MEHFKQSYILWRKFSHKTQSCLGNVGIFVLLKILQILVIITVILIQSIMIKI